MGLIISAIGRKRQEYPSGVWQCLGSGYVPALIATILPMFMFRK